MNERGGWGSAYVSPSHTIFKAQGGKPRQRATRSTADRPADACNAPPNGRVGATQVVPGHKVTDPESAVFQRFPSGGGFSNVFPRASFQQNAVSNYLKKYPPGYAPNIYNASGRAFPDVSANGLNYSVAINGEFRLVSGTSASAPTFASILSAVNDARLALGKKPVGWINPAIYSAAFNGVFNDITNGSNPNCGTQGFLAKPGWDPVTGLGTPNFPKMLARWLQLP
ncbi:hypothetical protein NUW54_g2556 [Trametes sanguinea]|uniref:Uncharacterized protein n=1 Tax=Trametes sanguinea TaxID=158606 RepID=A0ACC1Q385_9APHY|nr:hypothetical protein NUW54_g2556 [Trametes sanguinea]